jgi:hypothetical protein
MDMIFGDRTFDDLYIFGFAYLSHKFSQPFRHLSVQYLLPVFGDPDQVVLEVKYRMRSCPVMLHLLIVLKSSPEGEGFSPRRGHQHYAASHKMLNFNIFIMRENKDTLDYRLKYRMCRNDDRLSITGIS